MFRKYQDSGTVASARERDGKALAVQYRRLVLRRLCSGRRGRVVAEPI